MPTYLFEDFLSGCRINQAKLWGIALKTARSDFGLKTEVEAVAFVSEGLETPKFDRTAPLGWNEHYPIAVSVDSYFFFSGTKYGYLAFYRRPDNGLWMIKSLKTNDQSDPRNLTMFAALQKAGY